MAEEITAELSEMPIGLRDATPDGKRGRTVIFAGAGTEVEHTERPLVVDEEPWDSHAQTLRPPPARRNWLPLAITLSALLLIAVTLVRMSGWLERTEVPPAGSPPHPAAPEARSMLASSESASRSSTGMANDSAADVAGRLVRATSHTTHSTHNGHPAAAKEKSSSSATPVMAEADATTLARLLHEAEALEQANQRPQAVKLYVQALGHDPNDSVVLSRLSLNLLNLSRNSEAKMYAARAVTEDPANAEGWIVLGAVHQASGDLSAARKAYERCAALGSGQYPQECKRLVQ